VIARCNQIAGHLRDQYCRAASSVVLNLAEGNGRITKGDKGRFYRIALGSLRECQAVLTISDLEGSESWNVADKLGAHIYRLIQSTKG